MSIHTSISEISLSLKENNKCFADKIRAIVKSQVNLWKMLRYFIIETCGRGGYSESDFQAIENCEYRIYCNVYIHLYNGDLVSLHPNRYASDEAIVEAFLSSTHQFDAYNLINLRIERLSKKPTDCSEDEFQKRIESCYKRKNLDRSIFRKYMVLL